MKQKPLNERTYLPKIIVQSNVMTMSKQTWTLPEKKVLYVIFSQLAEHRRLYGEINLNSDLLMGFDERLLLRADEHPEQIHKTLKSLQNKPVEIRYGKKYVAVKPILYTDYDLKNHVIKVQISHEILPHYINLTKRFSRFALHTVLECKSVYSQRLFELCSMFSFAGLFSLTIEQMKELFGVGEQMYVDDTHEMIRKVVKVAQNELFDLYRKKHAELFFSFFERDAQIIFLIHQRSEPIRKSTGWAKMIAVLLSNILGYSQATIDDILIAYSTMHTMTDFSELFRVLARVKINTESLNEQRTQTVKILHSISILPNQNGTHRGFLQ